MRFDDGTYKHDLAQSVGSGDYMINRPRNDCKGCLPVTAGVFLDGYGVSSCDRELIDVDSELIGITRKASQCPTDQYIATNKPSCKTSKVRECNELAREDTRLSNPASTLRGTGINRWEWLCKNPQRTALVPFDYLIGNRLVVKDNHRPCVPTPTSQNDALPPSKNMNVHYDWSSRLNTPNKGLFAPQLSSCKNIPSL